MNNILRSALSEFDKLILEFGTGDAGIGGNATGTEDMQGDHIYAPGDARNPGHFGNDTKRKRRKRKKKKGG